MTPAIILYYILSYTGTALLLGGAAVIFRQARHDRANARALRALGFSLSMWGLVYLTSCFNPQSISILYFQPLSVFTLVAGGLFVIICLFYPLELAHPGWITPRRTIRLMLPYASVTLFYFVLLALLGQPVRALRDIPDLLDNLDEFNVWFRFVLYLTVCLYIVFLLVNTSVRAIESRIGNAASDPCRNRWLLIYGIGMIFITGAYLGVLLYGTLISMIIHRIICITFFSIVILNACLCKAKVKTHPAA